MAERQQPQLVLALLATDAVTLDARGSSQLTVISGDGTQATEILTLTGDPIDTETVTLDAKAYIFQDTLTDVDGNVLIGATASDSIDNLIAAITLGAGVGTLYATATTIHPTVTAAIGAGDTMGVTVIVGGVSGNALATTETLTNGSFGDTTFSGGIDAVTTVSRVDSKAAIVATTGAQNSFTVGTLTRVVTVVDWPFYRVSVADGPSRVALV